MNTSKHLTMIPAASDSETPRASSGLGREIGVTAAVVAILLAGALGGMFAPQSGTPVAEAQASAPQPSQEFVYFPSQFVNQGTEMPETAPTF